MDERSAWLSGAAATILVGASFPVTAALESFPPAFGQAARYLVGAAVLTAVARGRLTRPTPRELALLAAVAAAGMAGFNLFVVAAVEAFGGANTGVVVGASPIVLALVAGARTRRTVACAVAVAAGAALVTGTGGTFAAAGLLLATGALAGEVLFTLLAAPLLPRLGPLNVAAWAAILATAELLVAGAVTGERLRTPSAEEAAAIAYLAVLTTAVAFVCWFRAVQALGGARAGLLVGLMPVAAVLVEAVLDGALVTATEAAGVTLVVAAVLAGRRPPVNVRPAVHLT